MTEYEIFTDHVLFLARMGIDLDRPRPNLLKTILNKPYQTPVCIPKPCSGIKKVDSMRSTKLDNN